MVDLLEMIFQTQKPTWVDCKQLLFTLFNTEERMRVMTEARKWLQTQAPAGTLDTDRLAREALPDEEPNWSPDSEDGKTRLERAGAKKPTNMAKISEVFQKPDESPAAFYERLCEAYRIYTPFNPEALDTQTMLGPHKPMVRMKIGGQTVDFMVNTGAEHSEVTQKVAPLSGKEVTIIGATGDQTRKPFCRPRRYQLSGHRVIHEFLYLPDCPVPLMGRDFLAKMGAEITFAPNGSAQLRLSEETSPMILSLAVPREEERRLYAPQSKASPLEPELEEEFPLPGTNDYHPVQDLRAVNEVVTTLHATLPNPYTLLGLIPSEAEWFTCLDLKDAFFCLRLTPISQPLFAFEWENPNTGAKEQFTWTRLPQGFKNSPTLFSGALASDLSKFPGQDLGCVLLQYVDDLLLASST
ncbi:hypothetical protein QTO34_000567 [Cnephaeus nilssonii]|uniref:Uncharacterized protein n=1 Tax=Cnephaeus nilssonii TaxID=3371016 RepID=A0AA40ICQ7_CNENI|nr:hypothetical protein QTO34_000567 [Eptesicus nilssonii]